MRRNSKFLHIVVCAALGLSIPMSSCKDYDDDIDGLQQQIDGLAQDLAQLQEEFGALAYVKSVSFKDGVLTVVPNEGEAKTFEIPDNNTTYSLESKEVGGKVTITLKGNDGSKSEASFDLPAAFDGSKLTIDPTTREILYNGVATGATLPEDKVGESFDPAELTIVDGKVLYKGEPTGAELDVFDPKGLTIVDGKILYNGEETGATLPKVEMPTIPELTVIEILDGNGNVIGYTLKHGEDKEVNLKLVFGNLQGLVFVPEFYYQGIEAMSVNSFLYNKLLPKFVTVNADGDFAADQASVEEEVSVTPKLVARYHLNPSNVAASQLKKENMSFIIENKKYTKAGEAPEAKITEIAVANGILTVTATLNEGMIKDIEKDKEVTVLALQIGARGVKGDTLVTSDYAAVKAENTKGFLLADARKTVAEEVHLYTTAEDAIKNEAQFELVWNNEDGIDVAKLVATHKDTADCKVLENVAELGFEYTYELLGYLDGENKTSQSAHAALNGSMLRAQLTKDGQSVAWEDGVQSKATIGREPIVRVLLKEKANGNVVAVGYMKFEIVEEAEVEVPSEDIVNTFNYAFNAAYRPVCGGEAIEHALSWSQVEETIYTELGLSKAEFEKLFTLDGFVEESTPATQYDAVTATAEPVAEAIGEVVITTEDVDANMTEVLLWTVEENEAYELFTALDQEQKETTLKVNVRFTRELSSGAKHYVYVTFTWTPEELYINPTGSIDNATKLDEVWFTKDSAEKGFDEVHLNVAVPTTASDDNSDNCTYVKDLAQVFVGEEIIISGVDETNYPGFADEKLQKFFRFDKTMSIEAKGNDGKTYILTSADGIELIATQKDNASNFDKVAVLSKGKHPGSIVTYQDNAIAKALLNAYDHKELADGQTLEAKIELIVKDGCDRKMNLSNGTFDVKFLRPLSVNSTKGDNLQDALDGGDEIELAKVIGFTDWREFNLADSDKAHLFGFYGISAMAINEDAVLVVVNGKEEILKERYPSVQITYTPAETISVNDLGKFSWKNNAAALSQDVTLKLPVEVTYKWGVVKEWISVEVKKTIGQ